MKKYPVLIECTRKQKRENRRAFRRLGLRKAGKEEDIYYFSGRVNKRKYEKLQEHCRKYHISYKINNSYGSRSSNYRSVFFKEHPPYFGDYYFCTYCGRLIHKDKITVDHLYPVGIARKSITLQKKLQHKGISDINSPENLVPSCRKCNQKKSSKMGKWIIRGKIGKYPSLWIVRHTIRIVLFAVICYEMYTHGMIADILNFLSSFIHLG